MTPHGNDSSAADDPDNGLLDGAPSVETSGIGLLGIHTAHVTISLPAEEEDDDEDVVEGDILLEGASVRIEDIAIEDIAIEEPAVEDLDVEEDLAVEDVVVEASAGAEPLAVEDIAVEDIAVEDIALEDIAVDEPTVEELVAEEVAVEEAAVPVGAEGVDVEDGTGHDRESVEIDDVVEDEDPPAEDPEIEIASAGTAYEATGFEEIDPEDADDLFAADDEPESLDRPVEATLTGAPEHPSASPLYEKETDMNDRTDRTDREGRAVAPTERRDLARTATAESPVLVSRRIGELADVSERETSDLLTADRLLDPAQIVRPEPEGVWQHFLYSVTGGKVNVGDGKRARARKALDRRIAASLPGGGARFVAVVSRKGGVGKTTITTLLGQALADARDDRVIAVDANPDRGTLAERIARSSGRTVRDLVRERDNLRGYNDVSAIVARDETRLDVLASDSDPRIAEAFSGDEYRAVADVAAHYYSIVLTDTGTGIVHSVMGATLDRADRLVVVAGRSIDEARLASETLTWLEANGYEDQVRNAIVVLNMSSPGAPLVRQEEVEAHFRTRVRDVMRIPYDPQLATGGAIVFRDLQPATRAAARELAAKVVEGLQSVSTAA